MNKDLIKIYRYRARGILTLFFFFTLIHAGPVSANTSQVHALTISVSDPFFTTDTSAIDKQWYLPRMRVPEAWDISKGSSNVTVALVDTGIHASHIELNDGRVIGGFNTITNQAIAANSNSDDNGHGTAVAGIIGAMTGNLRGIAGINWNVRLMPIKALDASGTGEISAVAAGIVWATDHGANIINLSLGGGGPDSAVLSDAITYAFQHNVLIVAAAGNDQAEQGANLDKSPAYPVCADNSSNMVLGVAATDINDQKASFSDYGINCIDLDAPGQRILTTAFLPDNPSDNVLIYGSGTSLAAPMVSGVAALVKAVYPSISNVDLQKRLMQTADDIYPLNQTSCANGSCNGFLGRGRINALAALTPQPIADGSLVRQAASGNVYLVSNNTKRLVTSFVFNQRQYPTGRIIDDSNNQLAGLSTANPLPPLDGTLIKTSGDATVYVATGEVLRPVTFLVFVSRNFSFANVLTIADQDFNVFPRADWYWPPDGTLVLVENNPTVYVMDQQVRRPVTYFVFTQRHLSFAQVLNVSVSDFSHVPAPADQYWLSPLDGTLLKSADDLTVYVIEGSLKHPLTYDTFVGRAYSSRNIKIQPQAEIDVIAPGGAL